MKDLEKNTKTYMRQTLFLTSTMICGYPLGGGRNGVRERDEYLYDREDGNGVCWEKTRPNSQAVAGCGLDRFGVEISSRRSEKASHSPSYLIFFE